jgi:hypothetical protein
MQHNMYSIRLDSDISVDLDQLLLELLANKNDGRRRIDSSLEKHR